MFLIVRDATDSCQRQSDQFVDDVRYMASQTTNAHACLVIANLRGESRRVLVLGRTEAAGHGE